MSAELTARARSGTAWVAAQALVKHGLDLVVFLCLARWLMPQAFGVMALVNTVLSLVLVLSELGLGDALVQRHRLGPRTRDTAFWLSLGGAVCLALLLAAVAWPLAWAYGQPEVATITWAAMPLVVMVAFNTVPQALLQRELSFRPLAVKTLTGSLAGALTGLGLALNGAGVWSLIGQQLVSAAVSLGLLWWLAQWRPRWRFSRKVAWGLLGFARHVLLARGLNIVASKVDDAVIGAVLGPAALGIYAVASRLRLALEQVFCQGVDAVALSAFSRLAGNHPALAHGYLHATRLAFSLALPVFASAGWLAPHVLPLWIGDRWAPAMGTLQVLLVAAFFQSFLHFNHAVFRALGCPQRSWHLGAASLGLNLLLAGAVVGWGIEAVAWAYVARVCLMGPWGAATALRALGLGVQDGLRNIAGPVGAGALAALAAAALWQGLAGTGWPTWVRAVLICVPSWAVYGVWLWRQPGLLPRRLKRPISPVDSRTRRWVPGANRASRPA